MYEFGEQKVLTREEEEALFAKVGEGDLKARETLILSNLRFVSACVKPYQNCGLSHEELISHGVFGLIEAVDHFDADKGFRLITYAKFWIRKNVIKALDESFSDRKFSMNFSQVDDPEYFLDVADPKALSIEETCIENDAVSRIRDAVLSLRPNEREVIINHYGLFGTKEKTFSQIAEMRGRTKARVHQIEQGAILKLKERLKDMGA